MLLYFSGLFSMTECIPANDDDWEHYDSCQTFYIYIYIYIYSESRRGLLLRHNLNGFSWHIYPSKRKHLHFTISFLVVGKVAVCQRFSRRNKQCNTNIDYPDITNNKLAWNNLRKLLRFQDWVSKNPLELSESNHWFEANYRLVSSLHQRVPRTL